jgi:hypothetical protein
VTDSLQTPIRRLLLALHSGGGRFHQVFGTQQAEVVLLANAGIVVLGAGLVWFQFSTPLRTLLAAAGAVYVVLFVMLLRAGSAIAVGIIGGLIVACWCAFLSASLVAGWSLIAACCVGAYFAVQGFVFTLDAYRSFSEVLRNLVRTSGKHRALP